MGKVFHQLYYHFVWSTKYREPKITPAIRQCIIESVERKCRLLGCPLHKVNAVEDHAHVALEIPPSLSVGQVAGELKGVTSHDANQMQPHPLYWQRGYGAVTLRKRDLEMIKQYIENQEEHHASGKVWETLEYCGEETEPEEPRE